MRVLLIVLTIFYLFFLTPKVLADYLLPYPGPMPGHKLYRLSRIIDRLKYKWYWGNLGRIKYHSLLSDKYLVEAKTLFEYKQYLLAIDALLRSDEQVLQLPYYIEKVKSNIEQSDLGIATVMSMLNQHRIILSKLQAELPKEYLWTPEKQKESRLELYELLQSSLNIREQIVQ